MTEPRYGATPHEWDSWSTTLGLMTELLPTVCSPNATISPSSVLTNYHKVPCRYTTTRLVIGMPKWNEHLAGAYDIRGWSAEPDYGICLQMRTIQAFDVDITDAAIVARITETLGLYDMPRRWRSNSSKCLFLFHPYQTPSKKRVLKVGDGMIEMLGLGNQCLVAGQHPSGVRYQWDPFTSIPVLDDETVAWLMEDLRTDFGGKGTWSRGARVPKNVADPDGERRHKAEIVAAKAATAAAEAAKGAAKAGLVMTDGSAIRFTGDPGETFKGTGVFTPIVTDGTPIVMDSMDPDPVIDYLTENGFVKGEGDGGLLYVECPFELAHGKQGDATQTVYFPAGTGGYVLGHIKCLDGVCGDKTDRDFLDAWGWTLADGLRGFENLGPSVAPTVRVTTLDRLRPVEADPGVMQALGVTGGVLPPPSVSPIADPLYDRDLKTRVIRVHPNNFMVFCSYPSECGYAFTKNTFTNKLYATRVDGAAPGVTEEFQDDILTDLVMRARDKGMGPATAPRDSLTFAVSLAATKYDSAVQWIRSLPAWDGEARVESFCTRYLGCVDSPYHRAVSRYWWTAMAGRGLSVHGIQADMVPILMGAQGSGKSSTVRALVPDPEQYISLSFHTSHKEQALKMFGRLVGELAELSGLRGKDMEGTKEWLTTIKDNARVPYEKFPRNFARRLLFIGTTNRDDFATDTTGNRRLLPVVCGAAQDIPAIIRDRNQLWAEAAGLFDAGGIQWRDADRLGRYEHASVMAILPAESAIADWLHTEQKILITKEGICGLTWGELPYLRIMDVMMGAMQATKVQATQGTLPHQVGDVLRKLGYLSQRVRIDGTQQSVWGRPGIIGAAGIAEWKLMHNARAAK